MNNALVIVESPTKVASVQKILGQGYVVASTKGHFADIPARKNAVDVEHGFAVTYSPTSKGATVIAELRRLLASADELILATDADREGEMIAHLLVEALQPAVPVSRARFNAITPDAVRDAIATRGTLNANLVAAARSRRVLDHLYGFQLSPELWPKVRSGVSAGRVQSPALHMVVTRERERMAFVPAEFSSVSVVLATDPRVTAVLRSIDGVEVAQSRHFDSEGNVESGVLAINVGTAEELCARLHGQPVTVENVVERAYRRRAPFPYVTNTLLSDAINRLGLTSKAVQSALQTLFEKGLITYPRTDSPHMAPWAVSAARNKAVDLFGAENVPEKPRYPKAKNRHSQEAHEAVRPTDMDRRTVGGVGANAARVYEMIWRRTVASQMNDATGTTTTVTFTATATGVHQKCDFSASGTVITKPGYRLVNGGDDDSVPMPQFHTGTEVPVFGHDVENHVTKAPARFTEASLISALEEHGIGRPSTYASIIQLLRERYVWSKRGDRALIPTVTGFAVDQVMSTCYSELIDYGFTSHMEERLDLVVDGALTYEELLRGFWQDGDGQWPALLHLIESGRTGFDPRETPVMEFGVHPELGDVVTLHAGRSFKKKGMKSAPGRPYLRCGDVIVGIADNTDPGDLTAGKVFPRLTESREPRDLGDLHGFPVQVVTGIHGPYAKWNGGNYSLGKNIDLAGATMDDVIAAVERKNAREERARARNVKRK